MLLPNLRLSYNTINMERWSGRVALVTGASTGIGAGIATALVKNGMIVIGVARNVDRIKVSVFFSFNE